MKWKQKAADKIEQAGMRWQTKWADRLNKRFAAISLVQMKVLVVVFGLMGGGASLYFMGEAILKKGRYRFDVQPVRSLEYFDRTGEQPLPEVLVDEETFWQIQNFRRSDAFDSTIRARPGLLDSIELLEEIYHTQKNK